MDVIFETSKGREFSIEIGFFDTVLEIKQKVQKYEGLPASDQRLLLNGQELADDRDTQHYEIVQNSRIQLLVAATDSDSAQQQQAPLVADEEEGAAAAAAGTDQMAPRVRIVVKIPVSKRQLALDVDPAENVLRLRQRVHESEGIPINRFALLHGGAELQDQRALSEQGVADRAEITVAVRPPGPPLVNSAGSGGGGGGGGGPAPKRLKVMVLLKCGTKKIPVEVNASDNVGEMRKELQRLQAQLNFHLPADGYFFIYKQNVMDEDRSFRWHDVRSGDTVEIFNGSVTGGS